MGRVGWVGWVGVCRTEKVVRFGGQFTPAAYAAMRAQGAPVTAVA